MKDLRLTATALRAMASVVTGQKIDSVSLPTSLLGDIADQMETLISIIEENELASDRLEDYLLEMKDCVKVKAQSKSNRSPGDEIPKRSPRIICARNGWYLYTTWRPSYKCLSYFGSKFSRLRIWPIWLPKTKTSTILSILKMLLIRELLTLKKIVFIYIT